MAEKTRAIAMTCEYDEPCWEAIREPWCRSCLLRLIEQVNDLNDRLCVENERLHDVIGNCGLCRSRLDAREVLERVVPAQRQDES